MQAVDLIVPGSIETLTGGYLYDRRIFEGLAALGWRTKVHELPGRFPEPDDATLATAAVRLNEIPDGRLVVIDGLALTGLEPLLDSARRRLRIVALIHHPLALETGLDAATRKRLEDRERLALAQVANVITPSPWTRRTLAEYGVPAGRVAVVEPGVDRPALAPAREAGTSLKLLTVGAVTPRKGHALLVDALARIDAHAWTLRCAGSLDRDPATAAALVDQLDRLGLSLRVHLLGELTPAVVAREYAACDLFVLASHLEGYGMVVAEAVAHGVPVVATAAGAVADTLPPEAGVLVPPSDSAAFAEAVARLCDDRGHLARFKRGAREAAAAIPTWRESATCFAAALEAIGT